MNESGEEQSPTSQNVTEEDLTGKRDEALTRFYEWLSLFLRVDQAKANPELSIYSRIIGNLKAIPTEEIPMMAVQAHGAKHVLMYNRDWMGQIGYLEFVCTLCHEALHILMCDIATALKRISMFSDKERAQVWRIINLALDAANNDDLVEHHPHMRYGGTGEWVLPETFDMLRKQDWEFYFEMFMRKRDEFQELMQKFMKALQAGGVPGDGPEGEGGEPLTPMEKAALLGAKLELANAHDWGGADAKELSPEELEALGSMLEQDAKSLSKEALESHEKSCGSLPSHFRAMLDLLNQETRIHWTKLLSRLIKARLLGKRMLTETRPSKKRYIMFVPEEDGTITQLEQPMPIYPGTKRDRTYVILYAIDTSGSMSNMEVSEGLSEIQSLLKKYPDAHCVVVQCDTHISDVTVLGPNMDIEEYVEKIGRTSAGGTSFDQPFKLIRALYGMDDVPKGVDPQTFAELMKYKGVDLAIYHTDGYANNPPITIKPPCPVIWVLTKGSNLPWGGRPHFGTFLER